ncbi:carbamoyltransferase N-terminal domain-containing protein, partial [Paraburkholderia tuberum]
FLHDGAAVLVRDGRVIAAVEEERLNRIKHSNKFPSSSIQYCLASAGIQLSDIDHIAFYATEAYCNVMLERLFLSQPNISIPVDAKLFLRNLLMREFGTEVDPS